MVNKPSESAGLGPMGTSRHEYVSHTMELFEEPPMEVTLRPPGRDVMHYPVSTIQNAGPFRFDVNSSNSDYLLLNSVRLHGEVCIKEVKSGATVDATTELSVIQYWPQTLFKMIQVELNG